MIDWINNFFGIKNEVSVPTLISLIVFIIGGTINYIFTKIREFNQRKINRQTFKLLLSEVIKDLKSKEKNVAQFYPQISILNDKNMIFNRISISYLDTIFEFDFKEIYYSFRKKYFWNLFHNKLKNKAFHRIWNILRNQRYFEEKIEQNVSDLNSSFNSHLKSYNECIEECRKYNDELMHKYEGVSLDESQKRLFDYFKEQDNIWITWQELGEIRTFYYTSYTNLVDPMLNLNRKYSDLEVTLASSTLLLNCFLAYKEIENTMNTYQMQFKIYHKIYQNDQRILKKCLSIIQ